jgi:zinc protease
VRRSAAIAALLAAALAACPGPERTPTPRPPGGGNDTPPPVDKPPEPPAPPPVPIDWDQSGIDWAAIPTSGPSADVRPPVPVKFKLASGLEVLVIERPRLPIVSLELIVPHAGSQQDPIKQAGLAALTGDLLDEGAGERDALELSAELERLGASLGIFVRPDVARISLDTLSETLDPTLAILGQVLAAPRMRAEDFDRVKTERLAALRRRRDRPANVGGLVLGRVLFGAHAYGHPTSGYEQTVVDLTREQVIDFWKRRWRPAGSTLVVVGDVGAAALKARLEAALGAWKGARPAGKPELRLPTAAPPRLVVVDRPGASQTAVLIGRILWRRNDPRIHALQIANTALGGGFTSRLNQRLREELAWTYGASSFSWFGRDAATWTAESQIDTPHTAEGLAEMLRLIESMRGAPPPPDELARARTLLLRELPQELESNSGTAGMFAALVIEGLPLTWEGARSAALAKVTAAQVQAAATAAWPKGDLVVVAVGDLAKIRAGLLGLGLGNAIEVDPDGNLRGQFAP